MIHEYKIRARSEVGLSRLPVTEEMAGSNPVGPASRKLSHPLRVILFSTKRACSHNSNRSRRLLSNLRFVQEIADVFASIAKTSKRHPVGPAKYANHLIEVVFVYLKTGVYSLTYIN